MQCCRVCCFSLVFCFRLWFASWCSRTMCSGPCSLELAQLGLFTPLRPLLTSVLWRYVRSWSFSPFCPVRLQTKPLGRFLKRLQLPVYVYRSNHAARQRRGKCNCLCLHINILMPVNPHHMFCIPFSWICCNLMLTICIRFTASGFIVLHCCWVLLWWSRGTHAQQCASIE